MPTAPFGMTLPITLEEQHNGFDTKGFRIW
jgi:hypothetical protein